ncbi:MAG: hypothetical protein QG622_2209 [Actinomycetota bacterium]|nr:hypothetical protein [Actinomycetota bacterium]
MAGWPPPRVLTMEGRRGSGRRVVRRRAAGAVALLLSLAACSTGDGDDTATRTADGPGGIGAVGHALAEIVGTNPPTRSATSSPAGTSPIAGVPIRTLPAGSHRFSTPTKNIGCEIGPGSVRCDIAERSWQPPSTPATCTTDFGQGLIVTRAGTTLVCAGDSVLEGTTIVAYGSGVRSGAYECVSLKLGVTCKDTDSGHGFTLSRDAYAIF